ncbi:MAG: nucleotide sugar dehydrogenase [Chitinophagales bacterium]|nr:nucleotide sugar dehydrogenase [Chitinophagales bacterium]MCB9021330.1 nucleotide sugar dehydrogenase [Chitinophagales bacterium]HAE14040.1 Vi polysaccharide biosynthesis protein VipA/TviB [Bacteroidota bacterium]HQU39565.1 nucleotide sugar dehydrogenase [Chitinophagales bacterium]
MEGKNKTVAVIGLGYVGLPLAVEFGKRYTTIGYDINRERIEELQKGEDRTLEVSREELQSASALTLTNDLSPVGEAQIFIITVPTPVDQSKSPDLTPLIGASDMIGRLLKKGDIVIYESTVYPGCTEEVCVPVLEHASGLKYNEDFFCGYSPERINPGDKVNTLTKIKKVTSGSTPEVAKEVDALYASIIEAGTHLAPSLKVAEASKAIENAQRDLNISFMNELALIFERIGIDTNDVLEAAGTKWNFLRFKPGLVGGHCIGVDPYYLVHKAESVGYHPQVILSGRRVNDNMGVYVANRLVKRMISKGVTIKGNRVLILGIAFKENCPDTRNTKVVDIYNELREFGLEVDVYDPWVDPKEVMHEYGISLLEEEPKGPYAGILVAVAHRQFAEMNLSALKANEAVVFDTKAFLDRSLVDERL